jgi:hypothetical protein
MDVAESFSKQKPKDKLSRYSLNSLQKGECEAPSVSLCDCPRRVGG